MSDNTNQQKWKTTEIGKIPEKWDLIKIGENLYIKGRIGWKGLKIEEYLQDGFAIINGLSFSNFSVDYSKAGRISRERFEESPEIILKPKDILITKDGTIGKIAYLKNLIEPTSVASGIFVIRNISKNINTEFLFFYFRSSYFNNFIKARTEGSVIPHLYQRDFVEMQMPLPPLPEQTAIASVLCSLDDKIDLLHRQNATLEKMAETLFRQWFVEEAQEEWEEVELGNLIDVVIDNRGKTPPTVEFETEYPLIEVNALNSQSCLVDYTVIRKYVNKETFDTWFRKHLKVNDIIISTVGTIGVFSIHLANKGCIAQNLVGLRSSKVSSYFLYCFFKSNVETLINLDIGGVQPSIKVPHLLGLTIKLPPNDLLNKFNESVEICFNKIAINQTQIRTLTALRDNLLPKLMSGEVTINF